MDLSSLSHVISKVLEEVTPRLAELVQDALEQQDKKRNLVVVGLNNNIEERQFIDNICDKIGIDPADVADVFRDGRNPPGGRARIVKVKFHNLRSRRKFLTGFVGVRSDVPGGTGAFVRPDLTFRQRQLDRSLREELKKRREAGENIKIFRGRIVPN